MKSAAASNEMTSRNMTFCSCTIKRISPRGERERLDRQTDSGHTSIIWKSSLSLSCLEPIKHECSYCKFLYNKYYRHWLYRLCDHVVYTIYAYA